MGLSAPELARRVARELAGSARVWLSPSLDPAFFRALPGHAKLVDARAEIAVVLASQLSARGDTDARAPQAARVLAVLAPGARIVRQSLTGVRADRVFSELGVLDVTSHALVLVELAPGVSAVDFQEHAEPTLRISPRLTEVG